MFGPQINEEKTGLTQHGQQKFWRYALKTPLVLPGDDLNAIVDTYARPYLKEQDVLFLSEKMVACAQGRAIPVKNIRPGFFAKLLCRFVYKNPHGIGLAAPETMEMAIRECGLPRILLAALCGGIGKLLGRRGWFYRVAGYKAAAIDGPCPKTIPPYHEYVVLSPEEPQRQAEELSHMLHGMPVIIVDLNDFGGNILGAASLSAEEWETYLAILQDNPLGQTNEQTPMGLIRPVK